MVNALYCYGAMVNPQWLELPISGTIFHGPKDVITKTRLFKYTENLTSKNWKFSLKKSDIFHISAQNIDCGYSLEPPRRGGSNEYPQSMLLSRNKKNNVYPCKPQFHYIKVGLRGSKLYRHVFVMSSHWGSTVYGWKKHKTIDHHYQFIIII